MRIEKDGSSIIRGNSRFNRGDPQLGRSFETDCRPYCVKRKSDKKKKRRQNRTAGKPDRVQEENGRSNKDIVGPMRKGTPGASGNTGIRPSEKLASIGRPADPKDIRAKKKKRGGKSVRHRGGGGGGRWKRKGDRPADRRLSSGRGRRSGPAEKEKGKIGGGRKELSTVEGGQKSKERPLVFPTKASRAEKGGIAGNLTAPVVSETNEARNALVGTGRSYRGVPRKKAWRYKERIARRPGRVFR